MVELGRLDVLVNNAGIATAARPEKTTLEDWQQVLQINLTGPFLLCRATGPVMMERGGGRIINMASVAGLVGSQATQALPYTASKGAVVAMTRDLAAKWARKGIRVNAIAPGFFPTDMSRAALEKFGDMVIWATPAGRLGNEDDLKGAVVFLASRAAAYVNGHVLVVDGGMLSAR